MDIIGSSNSHFEKISSIVECQVVAIEECNQVINEQVEIVRHNSAFQHTKSDIWKMLSAMNIQEDIVIEHCYDFLCANPT